MLQLAFTMVAKYCDQRVCMSVCVSARISKKPLDKFHQIFYTCYLWRWRWLGPLQCNTLCPSGFVDGVFFHTLKRIGQNQRRRVRFMQFARWRQHRGNVCRLLLHLVSFVAISSVSSLIQKTRILPSLYLRRSLPSLRPIVPICMFFCPVPGHNST